MRKDKLQNKRLKLNVDLAKHKAGEVIIIQCRSGVPVDPYWRNRLKDAETDNCVSLVTKAPEPPVEKEPELNLNTKSKSGKKE